MKNFVARHIAHEIQFLSKLGRGELFGMAAFLPAQRSVLEWLHFPCRKAAIVDIEIAVCTNRSSGRRIIANKDCGLRQTM